MMFYVFLSVLLGVHSNFVFGYPQTPFCSFFGVSSAFMSLCVSQNLISLGEKNVTTSPFIPEG